MGSVDLPARFAGRSAIARVAWRIGRLSPSFAAWSSIRFVDKQRRLQAKRAKRAF